MDSDFIKSLPGQPGKEFEIKKCLDKLRETKTSFFNNRNNNNNNNNNDDPNLFGGPGGLPLTLPSLEDFVNGGEPEDIPELELGDGLLQTLGTEAEDLLDLMLKTLETPRTRLEKYQIVSTFFTEVKANSL